eukprot:Nk52_evm20s1763 gene=Nk52_evmTU20s1763
MRKHFVRMYSLCWKQFPARAPFTHRRLRLLLALVAIIFTVFYFQLSNYIMFTSSSLFFIDSVYLTTSNTSLLRHQWSSRACSQQGARVFSGFVFTGFTSDGQPMVLGAKSQSQIFPHAAIPPVCQQFTLEYWKRQKRKEYFKARKDVDADSADALRGLMEAELDGVTYEMLHGWGIRVNCGQTFDTSFSTANTNNETPSMPLLKKMRLMIDDCKDNTAFYDNIVGNISSSGSDKATAIVMDGVDESNPFFKNDANFAQQLKAEELFQSRLILNMRRVLELSKTYAKPSVDYADGEGNLPQPKAGRFWRTVPIDVRMLMVKYYTDSGALIEANVQNRGEENNFGIPDGDAYRELIFNRLLNAQRRWPDAVSEWMYVYGKYHSWVLAKGKEATHKNIPWENVPGMTLFSNSDVQGPEESKESPPRFVVWTCRAGGAGACGGHGDRLIGILSVFALALVTDSVFLIHHPEPQLTSSYLPNAIDWTSPVPSMATRVRGSPSSPEVLSTGVVFPTLQNGATSTTLDPDTDIAQVLFGKSNDPKHKYGADVVYVWTNFDFSVTLAQSCVYAKKLQLMGLYANEGNGNFLFGRLFFYLFRYSSRIESLLQGYTQKSYNELKQKMPHLQDEPVRIGIHIRTGEVGGVEVSNRDAGGDGAGVMFEMAKFWQSYHENELHRARENKEKLNFGPVVWFVATDNAHIHECVARHHRPVMISTGEDKGDRLSLPKLIGTSGPKHADFQAVNEDEWGEMIAEQIMLMESDVLLYSRSGFSETAYECGFFTGFWAMKYAPKKGIQYRAITPEGNDGTEYFQDGWFHVSPARSFGTDAAGSANLVPNHPLSVGPESEAEYVGV